MIAPTLHTERLTLRMPVLDDFESYAAFCADERVQYEFANPLSREEAWAQFGKDIATWALRGYGPWSMVVNDSNAYIGEIGIFHPINYPQAELGWSITEAAFEGKGFAFEAGKLVLEYFANDRGWTQLVNYIDPANKRSRALAERLGGMIDPRQQMPEGDTAETCATYRYDLGGINDTNT